MSDHALRALRRQAQHCDELADWRAYARALERALGMSDDGDDTELVVVGHGEYSDYFVCGPVAVASRPILVVRQLGREIGERRVAASKKGAATWHNTLFRAKFPTEFAEIEALRKQAKETTVAMLAEGTKLPGWGVTPSPWPWPGDEDLSGWIGQLL